MSTIQPPSDVDVPILTIVLGTGVGDGDGEGEGGGDDGAGAAPAGPAWGPPAAVGAPAAGFSAGPAGPPGVAADWVGAEADGSRPHPTSSSNVSGSNHRNTFNTSRSRIGWQHRSRAYHVESGRHRHVGCETGRDRRCGSSAHPGPKGITRQGVHHSP